MQARAREIRSSYFYLPIIFKFLCRPECIKSVFEGVNWDSSNNTSRETIPYICDSIAERMFSEITVAATINCYPAPGRYRERGIVFARFLSLYVCFFLSLFVSLSARLRENGWTDLHEIFREGVQWQCDDLIQFWVNSGKRVVPKPPKKPSSPKWASR